MLANYSVLGVLLVAAQPRPSSTIVCDGMEQSIRPNASGEVTTRRALGFILDDEKQRVYRVGSDGSRQDICTEFPSCPISFGPQKVSLMAHTDSGFDYFLYINRVDGTMTEKTDNALSSTSGANLVSVSFNGTCRPGTLTRMSSAKARF